MSDKIELHIVIDADKIEQTIRKSKDVQNDEQVFHELSWLMQNKKAVDELNDQWEALERKIKEALNDKAKSLLGPEYKALDGDGWSLRRSLTGSIYQIANPEAVPEDLLEVKLTVKSKEVGNYIKANSKLPDGLAYNPNRNESLKVTLK
jgi:hypothetical protein